MQSKLSVIIISNGLGPNLKNCMEKWSLHFKLGFDLYVCGPKQVIMDDVDFNYDETSIIDFSSSSNFSFPINKKKKIAFDSVNSEYVYFVHDRFLPGDNFREEILALLNRYKPDFGAVNVYNSDGSLSLSELRLKSSVLGCDLDDFVLKKGRASCLKENNEASDKIALNGGQFFLRYNKAYILERPMHWGEMEDDIMSLDLIDGKGIWLSSPHLITMVHKNHPRPPQYAFCLKAKIVTYSALCRLLKFFTLFSKYHVNSISDDIDQTILCGRNHRKGYLIIDPLHLRFFGEYYGASLEKYTTALRYYTNGKFDFSVKKIRLGWLIS